MVVLWRHLFVWSRASPGVPVRQSQLPNHGSIKLPGILEMNLCFLLFKRLGHTQRGCGFLKTEVCLGSSFLTSSPALTVSSPRASVWERGAGHGNAQKGAFPFAPKGAIIN